MFATLFFRPKISCKTPAKRSQQFNATYRTIVGRIRLRAFGHNVATCCDVLRHVGQSLQVAFVDVARCFSHFASFVQQCCPRACALVRFSTLSMRQDVQHGGQQAICYAQQCCDMLVKMLRQNVAIVWSGLVNTGPTMLQHAALNCCNRLAGA